MDALTSTCKGTSRPDDRNWWRERIQASRADPAELYRIDAALQCINAPWSRALRMQAIKLRREALPLAGALTRPTLPDVTGQPLYRYRLDAGSFDAMQDRLRTRVGGQDSRLTVWWAAEWFRRGYTGGALKWDHLNRVLGWELAPEQWRDLVDEGLAAWQLKPLRLGGQTFRLRSLARQGGFPVAALRGDNRGRLGDFLENLVSRVLPSGPDQASLAFIFAEELSHILPATWREDEFLDLSASLALAIVRLRRDAAAGGLLGAVAPSEWLDKHRQDWRNELPLSLDEDGARLLLDKLMRVPPLRGPAAQVHAERILIWSLGTWREHVRLNLSGTLPLAGADPGEWSRLRLFAAGSLARHVAGEVAAVEPDGTSWISSPSPTGAKLHPVPFSTPIEIEARGDGNRVAGPLTLARGQAVDGPILVLRSDSDDANRDDDADGPEPPGRLVLLGTSAGSFRVDPVWVLLDEGWTVDGEDDSTLRLAHEAGGRTLWRLSGTAVLKDPTGDRFRVRTTIGAEDQSELNLQAHHITGMTLQGFGGPLSWGPPRPFVRQRGGERAPRPGEVMWRPAGERTWRPMQPCDGLGLCEFGLHDVRDADLLDRKRCLVLPPSFRVRTGLSKAEVEVTVDGWPGEHHIEGAERHGYTWRIPAGKVEARLHLRRATAPSATLILSLPRKSAIAAWNGDMQPSRSVVGLADLSGLVAWSHGKGRLLATLLDRGRATVKGSELHWTFQDELALGSTRGDVTALLCLLGELDASVRLRFPVGDAAYDVREFSLVPPRELEAGQSLPWLVANARPGDRLAIRHVRDPAVEHDVTPYDSAGASLQAVLDRPAGTFLAFLRRNGRVASRPVVVDRPVRDGVAPGRLGAAMLVTNGKRRQAALDAFCEEAAGTGPAADALALNLVHLVTGLDGLPPSTFDVLKALPEHPRLLVRMLFTAGRQDMLAVLALSDGLRFAWPLIPHLIWQREANRAGATLFDALPGHPLIAMERIDDCKKVIVSAEPALAPVLGIGPPAEALSDAVQTFLRRNHDERQGGHSPFRPSMKSLLPPLEQFDPRFWRALDAACAAATASVQGCTLTPEQVRCVKEVARQYSSDFGRIFAARWKELIRDKPQPAPHHRPAA